MRKELARVGKKISGFLPDARGTVPQRFLDECLAVLPAGGESSRFRSVAGDGTQKSAYLLPDGTTMIERTIVTYRDLGVSRFLILLFHHAHSIEARLEDGKKYGVSISYSYDPGKSVGRGGAMAHAFVQQKILPSDRCIVHNPDDQFVGNRHLLFSKVFRDHMRNEKRGALATAVVASGADYGYTGMSVRKGKVTECESYPFIPIPTHTGVTVFSPGIASYFKRYFDPDKKSDFETVLFPILIKEKKLYAVTVGKDVWIPVNDEKGLRKLLVALKT